MLPIFLLAETVLRRRSEAGGCGVFGCFGVVLAIGFVLFLVLRGRRDKPELLGASKRAMGSGPIGDHTFATPYAKCPTCSASGDKMKQQWDGLRKVTWTCGYCGNVAGVQELKDEELPPSARQRLGLDVPHPSLRQGQPGGGGGMGGLLTGMMIGSMMGGHGHRGYDDRENGDSSDASNHDDWGDGGAGGDSGGDWGDSAGGDFGGGDSGGGDW